MIPPLFRRDFYFIQPSKNNNKTHLNNFIGIDQLPFIEQYNIIPAFRLQ